MTSGWKRRALGDLLQLQNGFAFDSKKFGTTGTPLIRIRDLKRGTETDTCFDGEYDKRYLVKRGDLLIGMDGEFRCHEWKGPEALLNQRVCRLQGFSGDLLPRFVLYGINKYLKDIEDVTAFATVKHLSSKQILGVDFPAPSIEEQHRIVALLDEAFAGIATAKANVEKSLCDAREVSESISEQVLDSGGGDELPLESVAADDCSLSYGIVQPGNDLEGGLPVVRPVDLTRDVITLDGLKRIDPELALGYQRTKLQGGELLLCVRGTTGTVSIAAPELEGANVTRGIVPIRFNPEQVTSPFGYHLMKSAAVQSQIRENTYGTALMQINIGDLRNIKVKIPPLSQQNEIAKRLDTLREEAAHIQSLYTRKLAALDQLKQSLLQRAFSGQL